MNRYTTLAYSNLNDLPLLQLPFEQLQGILSASQQAKDQFDELSGLTPKYIQNSPSDVKLAGTVKQYQNNVAAQLADIAASGDANKYRRELANARRNIVKMWQPGGAANALETRYAEDLKDQETVRAAFKDNAHVGEYIIRNKQYGDVDYNAAQGTYKNLNRSTYFRDIKDEDISKWFQDNSKIIKEQLFNEGVSNDQINSITSVRDYWAIKGVPFNRLVAIFDNMFPDDFKKSIYQKAAADKYFNPSLPDIGQSPYQLEEKDGELVQKMDKEGNYLLDLTNPIGRLFQGYGVAGTYQDIEHDRKVIDDKKALEDIKHANRKKEIDYENRIQTNTMMTRLMNNNNAMPELKIDENGNLLIDMNMEESLDKGYFKGGSYSYNAPKKAISGIEMIKSGKAEEMAPGITGIYNKFSEEPFFKELSPAQQSKYIGQQYNNLREQMQTFDVAMDIPTGANADKQTKSMQYQVVGEKGAWGLMGQAALHVYNPSGGINGEVMPAEKLAEKLGYGKDVKAFQEAARWTSTVRADNPAIPSGHHVHVKDKKSGQLVTILVSPESVERNVIKTPAYVGNAPRFNPKEQSEVFFTNIPEIDNVVGGPMYTRRETVFPSDQLEQARRGIENAYARGEDVYDDKGRKITSLPQLVEYVSKFENEKQNLLRNPANNKPTIQLGVYNANTQERIGGQETWDAINNQIEARARNYGQE